MKRLFSGEISIKKEESEMNDELNIDSFRIENLYLTEEESLNWFKSSSLYENYQNTCKDWD